HLDDDATALAEAARLLKPGGTLVVTVPALPSLWGAQDVVSHHRRRYTKRTLRGLFARAGLPAPEVTYFNTLLLPPLAAVRWLARARGPSTEPTCCRCSRSTRSGTPRASCACAAGGTRPRRTTRCGRRRRPHGRTRTSSACGARTATTWRTSSPSSW